MVPSVPWVFVWRFEVLVWQRWCAQHGWGQEAAGHVLDTGQCREAGPGRQRPTTGQVHPVR